MTVPLNLAAALNDSRYVVTVSPEFGTYAFHTGEGDQMPDEDIIDALRTVADRLETKTSNSSPRADEETVRPAQADPLHAPGRTTT